jgi:WD40 repeat protein
MSIVYRTCSMISSVHQDEILSLAVSHNNEYIVTGSRDRFIIVLRFETGEIEHSIEQHTDAVTAVALTQDDALLISGLSCHLCSLVNFTERKIIVCYLASRDQTIKRWTFHGMHLLDIIDTIGSPITNMIISTDDTFIIVSCDNTTVQVKSLVTGSDIHNLDGHATEVTSLAVSHDSMCCYVGCSNAHIYVYNLRSRLLLRTLTHHDSTVNDLFISADDHFLFSAAQVCCFNWQDNFSQTLLNVIHMLHSRIQSML